jgi:tRNA nucleotidyltransferase (CCA-adding enzyme)
MFQFAEVGGAVRDSLLGHNSKDVDFVAIPTHSFDNADVAFTALENNLSELGFKIFISTPQFFTVRAQVPNDHPLFQRTNVADFVLARKDGPSSDGRRPDFVIPGSLMDDLQRRDFTMNSIAILDEKFVDPFGGITDISNRIIRFVGNPMDRISEDGLRAMRALRFAITKDFLMANETKEAVNSQFAARMLQKVSIERISGELQKMFAADTIGSIQLLSSLIMPMQQAIFRDNLKLMPTLRQ